MAVQVVENQNDKIMDELFEKVKKKKIMEKIKECVPAGKADVIARKTFLSIYKAIKEPEIEKIYNTYHKSNENEFIRTVRKKVDGYIDYNEDSTLEKYNPESDTWEEYQEPTISLEEIKEQLGNIQYKTLCTAYDIETYGKMLDRLPDSSNGELLSSSGLMCIGRALQDKAAQLLLDVEHLDSLESDLRKIVENRENN